jgi:HAD superfamily hydrolase (TIGR01490 family)
MTKEPKIYLFDMDHTLIDNDCDVSWKQFVVRHSIGPADSLEKADYYYREYCAGTLDFNEFIKFQLAEFKGSTEVEMASLADWHFNEYVKDRIYPDAVKLVKSLLAKNKIVAILSSTNRVLAAPVARALGIRYILTPDLEMVRGNWYTGYLRGSYPVGPGKVETARRFCSVFNVSLAETAYYGDAVLDQFILGESGFPTVVNPHPELAEIARKNKWPELIWKL